MNYLHLQRQIIQTLFFVVFPDHKYTHVYCGCFAS